METQTVINEFAKRSFRDVADQDYIAARLSYRAHLREPFLWSSLQAFEKYLKAILLFNGKSSKNIDHNLNKALRRVESIEDIGFSLPKDVKEFISYLDHYGSNRYLEYSTHLQMDALLKLDRSVWYVRRYCFYMRGSIERNDGVVVDLLPYRVAEATRREYEVTPHKYQLFGGFLEEAIKKNKEQSKHLIQHNFYYGRTKKNKIKNYKWHMSSTNSVLAMHPDSFVALEKLVKFSKETRDYYTRK